ncbi:hypothetical protein HZS55_06375 [Halosimplex rubrum]|uniref:SipW-cognate class signal peptide n=1 Tax=Halosimplex rubrum TaxID=869889 RepID=A0A7D5P3Y7_9EURY|nr:SipW-dependent-type signal peptide-containing protein [Halosimplex rubrum]QLH76942.1 hypothetical protein HZS55_06375 [Halosimplex rubrum]
MSDKEFGLSRRQMLAGLGTIGVASAGAGLGTTALFSDEESFEGNSITAGTLDMSVTASIEAANEYWAEQVDLEELEATADGEAVTGLQVSDVKPGDWGIICFDISIGDNPGYVQVTAADLESRENGYTEPEPEDDNGEGELEEAMLAEVYGNFDESADGDPPRSHLSERDPTTPEGTTLQTAYQTYRTGVTLGGLEDPIEVGADEDAVEWCLLLYVPEDVGNEIQSDGLSFDLTFAAEQVRNNDTPFGAAYPEDPWLATAQTDAGGVFWNQPGDDNEFALSPGDTFGDLPEPGQPIYVNTTAEPISVAVDDGTESTSVSLNVGAYDGSDFHDQGSAAPWVRIPTGIGTPHPSGGDDYEFVGISETSDGYEVEWQPVSD